MLNKKALVAVIAVGIAGVIIASSLVITSALVQPVGAVINRDFNESPYDTSSKVVSLETVIKYPELYNAMNETDRKVQQLIDICSNDNNACAGYGAPPIETSTMFQIPGIAAKTMVSDSVFGFESKSAPDGIIYQQSRIQVGNSTYGIVIYGTP